MPAEASAPFLGSTDFPARVVNMRSHVGRAGCLRLFRAMVRADMNANGSGWGIQSHIFSGFRDVYSRGRRGDGMAAAVGAVDAGGGGPLGEEDAGAGFCKWLILDGFRSSGTTWRSSGAMGVSFGISVASRMSNGNDGHTTPLQSGEHPLDLPPVFRGLRGAIVGRADPLPPSCALRIAFTNLVKRFGPARY